MGFGVIVALFVAEGAVDIYLTRSENAAARHIVQTSLYSLEAVLRVARYVDRHRVLVEGHIFAHDVSAMAAIEDEMAEVKADLQRAEAAYNPLANLPEERSIWDRTRRLIADFDRYLAQAVALDRRNERQQAYRHMVLAAGDYDAIHRNLEELVRINERGAATAMARVDALQRTRAEARWIIRIAGVLLLCLFAWWGLGRIGDYEKRLDRHIWDLEERNRELDAFAGRVAHDLRGSLGPIALAAPVLRASADRPAEVRDIANRMERWSDGMSRIVDGLLEFARASQRPSLDEAAPLVRTVDEIREQLAPLVDRIAASVEIEALPDVEVRCSPALLHTVIANLFENAVKFLEGQKERRVRLAARVEGASCRIDVEDTGPGIPADVQDKIFEPFYRVEGARAPGSGIGLATVRRIVLARGGRIEVESAEGHGSRFTVWLPLATPPHAQATRARVGLRSGASEGAG